MQFPLEITKKHKKFDIVFVSPLERALRTASEVIKQHKINSDKVIVLPELSEVLSKICDFTSDFSEKKKKYPKFDFRKVDELNLKGCWQDQFVDEGYQGVITRDAEDGNRYLTILKEIFPTPL